jgi:hypothetical protein
MVPTRDRAPAPALGASRHDDIRTVDADARSTRPPLLGLLLIPLGAIPLVVGPATSTLRASSTRGGSGR